MSSINGQHVNERLSELIAARDRDAAARFYDAHAGMVRAYVQELCVPESINDATLEVFVDFLGRAHAVGPDGNANDLLRKAARTAASASIRVPDAREPACYSVPELAAARMNGDLVRSDKSLREHVIQCPVCQRTIGRLQDAEAAWARQHEAQCPSHLRRAWLRLIVGDEPSTTASSREPDVHAIQNAESERGRRSEYAAEPAQPVGPAAQSAPASAAVAPNKSASEFAPTTAEAAVRVKGRRGGLVGAARRLAGSKAVTPVKSTSLARRR